MPRKDPATRPKNHMRGSSGLISFLRFLFAWIPCKQTALFWHLLYQACFVFPRCLSQKVRISLSSIVLSQCRCMWGIVRALHFWECLSFLEAGSMSRNCFKELGVVREKCPYLAWNTNCQVFFLSFFLHLSLFSLVTLFGRQLAVNLEKPGLIRHGECVGTASLCLAAKRVSFGGCCLLWG